MRRLAGEDPFELRLQMLGGGETGVCTLSSGLLVSALPVDPVTEVGVDQLIEGPPPFAIRCSSAVIVDQRVKTVSSAVPDVPDEGPLVKKRAVLGEEGVAQPLVERLGL